MVLPVGSMPLTFIECLLKLCNRQAKQIFCELDEVKTPRISSWCASAFQKYFSTEQQKITTKNAANSHSFAVRVVTEVQRYLS